MDRSLDRYLWIGLLFSFLINGGLIAVLLGAGMRQFVPVITFPVSIEILPTEEKPAQKQLVSPSEQTQALPPKEARFESDKDSSTPKEQIKRGDPFAGQAGKTSTQRAEPKQSKQSQEQEPEKENNNEEKLTTLKLGTSELLSQVKESEEQKKRDAELTAKIANSNPGNFGTNDYLPGVQDGEMTMLNAKANQYAVFVRRVAQQVFGHITRGNFTSLPINSLTEIQSPVRFRAILSPSGSLIKIEPVFSSHVQPFDKLIESGVKAGASDPNPPKAAAAKDGNFYFLFQAEAKGWVEPNPRTGTMRERRWLMLSTGLE